MVKGTGSEVRPIRVLTLFPFSVHVTLGKLFNLSEPQFRPLYNGFLIELLQTLSRIVHIGFGSWWVKMPSNALSPHHTFILA